MKKLFITIALLLGSMAAASAQAPARDTVYQNGRTSDKVTFSMRVEKVGDTLLAFTVYGTGGGNVTSLDLYLEFDIGARADVRRQLVYNVDTSLEAVTGSRSLEVLAAKQYSGTDYAMHVRVIRTNGQEGSRLRWSGRALFTMVLVCKTIIKEPTIRLHTSADYITQAAGPGLQVTPCDPATRIIPVVATRKVFHYAPQLLQDE